MMNSTELVSAKPQHPCVIEVKGRILNTFSLLQTLIIVQLKLVLFWKMIGGKWAQVCSADRKQFPEGTVVNRKAGGTREILPLGVLFVELWVLADSLKAACYYYSATGGIFKYNCVSLEGALGTFRDVMFCIIDDLSIFACWSVSVPDAKTQYQGTVKKYTLNAELDTVLASKEYMCTLCDMTYFECIGEEKLYVLGNRGSLLFLWNHMNPEDWTSLRLNHPGLQNRLMTCKLHWACMKGEILFVACEAGNCLIFKMVQRTTASRKIICQISVPEGYDNLIGITMVKDKMVAVFRNGVLCWSLTSFKLRAESEIHDVKRVYLGVEDVILVGINDKVTTVPVETYTKSFTL